MGEGALQVLITLAGGVNTFVMCWNMAMALPMRGRTAYLVASGAAMAFDIVTGEVYPAVTRIHFLLCMFILPPFLMRGPVARRLVATALCIGVAIAGEVTGFLFLVLAGKPIDAAAVMAEDPVLFLALRLLAFAVLVACGRVVCAFMARWTHGARINVVLPRFAATALCCAVLASIMYSLFVAEGISSTYPLARAGVTCMIALPLILVVLLAQVERARRTAIARAQADVAQEQLDACLAEYDHVMRATVRTAQLRHDARNHLQAIDALMAEGDFERAAAYAREMADLLAHEDGESS
ncbi:hypothetical protein [Collinsella sp. An307]|uniref:hypothetical protein n=1 Tax=Collinsella sp. An307 TaxID=1965630 RepID=UPI000B368946|nr:hypothetical protein [Collinsella sp. An307]OUO20790.1 hypothetical protein B5F89_04460 [Collinsella sp. An307]